jgi:hypothetical protein
VRPHLILVQSLARANRDSGTPGVDRGVSLDSLELDAVLRRGYLYDARHLVPPRNLHIYAIRAPRSYRTRSRDAELLSLYCGSNTLLASPTDKVETYWERPIVGDTRRAA